MRSQNNLIRTIIDKNLAAKRPLGRPRLIWKDTIKKDVEALNGGSDLKVRALDRESWSIGFVTGWFSGRQTQRRRRRRKFFLALISGREK